MRVDATGESDIALPWPRAIPIPGWAGPAAGVAGAGWAGWQTGSAIYPHISQPLGDMIDIVCRTGATPKDCDKEWEDAYRQCGKLLSSRNPPRGLTGGHRSLADCARGFVSERCGGNKVGAGSGWKWKPPGATSGGQKE
jgi:hypothetical protein